MRLFLIRHGQTQWNVEGRAQGHTDIPLDEHGEKQAQMLASALSCECLDRIISSDLQRSAGTAQVIANETGVLLELLPELRERNIGDWEGLPYRRLWQGMDELEAQGIPRELIKAPNGESIRQVWDRLDSVVAALDKLERPVAVVTHGGTGALLLAKLLRGTIQTGRAFRLGNCAITELERRQHDSFVIIRYNDISHLSGLRVMEGNLESAAT